MEINPFDFQDDFIFCPNRFVGAFAGKRGGKTEAGAIRALLFQDEKPNYTPNQIDPYFGAIVAPTTDMLEELSWAKFMAYSKSHVKHDTKRPHRAIWHDDSIVRGYSADKPQRMEGRKWNWVWLDEVFQMKESAFLECMARISDSEGYMWCTGSLGPDIINPKQHWAYKYFKGEQGE